MAKMDMMIPVALVLSCMVVLGHGLTCCTGTTKSDGTGVACDPSSTTNITSSNQDCKACKKVRTIAGGSWSEERKCESSTKDAKCSGEVDLILFKVNTCYCSTDSCNSAALPAVSAVLTLLAAAISKMFI